MLGLKRGTVQLCEHERNWEIEAQRTILCLKEILGDVIRDIQHVGSTAIFTIKAKPIIDIAIAVDNFDDVLLFEQELKKQGFYYRPKDNLGEQLLFASGSYYEGTGDIQTHFIHIVKTGSMDWINYINFRDYLNSTPSVAKEYEDLKVLLALKSPVDNSREKYLQGKQAFITYTLRKALIYSYRGKMVNIVIDKPIGSVHPQYDNLIYTLNCGAIPGVYGGDGEELDVYLMGVNTPVKEYNAKVIAAVHRHNDVEDKLVAAPKEMCFTKAEIEDAIRFQEQYFESEVEVF